MVGIRQRTVVRRLRQRRMVGIRQARVIRIRQGGVVRIRQSCVIRIRQRRMIRRFRQRRMVGIRQRRVVRQRGLARTAHRSLGRAERRRREVPLSGTARLQGTGGRGYDIIIYVWVCMVEFMYLCMYIDKDVCVCIYIGVKG